MTNSNYSNIYMIAVPHQRPAELWSFSSESAVIGEAWAMHEIETLVSDPDNMTFEDAITHDLHSHYLIRNTEELTSVLATVNRKEHQWAKVLAIAEQLQQEAR